MELITDTMKVKVFIVVKVYAYKNGIQRWCLSGNLHRLCHSNWDTAAAAPLSLSPRPRLSISGNYESFDNPPLFWKTVLSKILRAENSLLVEITFNGAPCWTEASKGPIVMDGLQYIIQLEMQTLIKERKCIADTESNLII